MKKYSFRNLTFLVFIFGYMVVAAQPKPVKPKSTQSDPTAEKNLSDLKKYFSSLTNYTFNFSATISYPDAKNTENFSGNYISSGTNKYYIKLNQLEIFSDGTNHVNINHQSKEIQINDLSTSKNTETPFDFIKKYNKLFKYRIKETLTKGKVVIELVPLQKNSNIYKIDLSLNTTKQQILNIKLYERSGIRVVYSISSQIVNSTLSANQFTLQTANYKGYETLDMR